MLLLDFSLSNPKGLGGGTVTVFLFVYSTERLCPKKGAFFQLLSGLTLCFESHVALCSTPRANLLLCIWILSTKTKEFHSYDQRGKWSILGHKYGLLNKHGVKMAGYPQSCVFTRKKRMRPISSHLDRKSLVNWIMDLLVGFQRNIYRGTWPRYNKVHIFWYRDTSLYRGATAWYSNF